MTTTPTSGAADLPEALRRSTAADGKTELFNLPGYPLMVRAVDFNRIHTESEMRRAALLDEMQKTALAAGQATAAPQGAAYAALRSMIEGMSVSVDVSTGDHDAGHRYFGTVTEVMECQGDKHGVTLLVQDAEPNFTATPTAPSTPSSTAQQASTVTNYTTLGAAMRAIRQSIQMIGDPEDECMRAVKRVLRGAVIIVEDSGDEVAAPAAPAQPVKEGAQHDPR